jgi:hypothetical protein
VPDAGVVRGDGNDAAVRHASLLALVVLSFALPSGAGASQTTRITVPEAGLSLTLPPSWKAVNSKTATSIATQALAKENPQLAAIIAELDRPGTGLAFFAFDPTAAASFATNINIVTSVIPAGVTIAQYRDAAASELRRLPGRVGTTSTAIAQLPGGQAVRSTVDVRVKARGNTIVARVSQWAFLRPQKSVVVSFTTRVSTYGRYAATFKKMARSVRFG